MQSERNDRVEYASIMKEVSLFDSSEELDYALESLESEKPQYSGLKRELKNRHVVMISLAGVIGVGIFLNTVRFLLWNTNANEMEAEQICRRQVFEMADR